MALPVAGIAHAIAGRTRLSFRTFVGDTEFFGLLADRLQAVEGIAEVRARPLTGSVIVQHELPLAALLSACAGIFSAEPQSGTAPSETFSVKHVELAGAGMVAALALLQTARGRMLPPAATLLWYAAGIAGLPLGRK